MTETELNRIEEIAKAQPELSAITCGSSVSRGWVEVRRYDGESPENIADIVADTSGHEMLGIGIDDDVADFIALARSQILGLCAEVRRLMRAPSPDWVEGDEMRMRRTPEALDRIESDAKNAADLAVRERTAKDGFRWTTLVRVMDGEVTSESDLATGIIGKGDLDFVDVEFEPDEAAFFAAAKPTILELVAWLRQSLGTIAWLRREQGVSNERLLQIEAISALSPGSRGTLIGDLVAELKRVRGLK